MKLEVNSLIQLDNHKIIFGDSTNLKLYEELFEEQFIDLVVTDPPYNVNYKGGLRQKNQRKQILNDNLQARYKEFIGKYLQNMKEYMNDGAPYYIFTGYSEIGTYQDVLSKLDYYQSIGLIWAKNHFVLSFADYKAKHEHILYGWKKGKAHSFYGAKNSSTVLSYPKPVRSKYHPTTKPQELIRLLIENSSEIGNLIFDAFLGSGTTLLESHKLGRICYGFELDEEYIRVIVNRYKHLNPNVDVIIKKLEV